jgi:hypothetical protein
LSMVRNRAGCGKIAVVIECHGANNPTGTLSVPICR